MRGKDPLVAPFWNSCRECHLRAPIDFSSKSDAEILKIISTKEIARKMLHRLDWAKNPEEAPMPPKGKAQNKALAKDDIDAARDGRKSQRQEMIEILQGFINAK